MSLRRRILFVFVGFLAVTVPIALVLSAVTPQPAQYLHWWTSVFWIAVMLIGLQEIYVYNRPFKHGRLSGIVLLLAAAYVPTTSIYNAYRILFPGGMVDLFLNFSFVTLLIIAGGHIGQRIPTLQRVDAWFYRNLLDELRRMQQ